MSNIEKILLKIENDYNGNFLSTYKEVKEKLGITQTEFSNLKSQLKKHKNVLKRNNKKELLWKDYILMTFYYKGTKYIRITKTILNFNLT